MLTTPPTPANLPRILCLHGGGTSALIFSIQIRSLVYSLRAHFHFVFVDAPFTSGPGPGVLPAFEECGPFHSWISPTNELLGQQRVRQVLREAVAKDGGEFAGVLGFSQGGMQTSGLLADAERGEDTGLPRWEFGVLLCATYPPLSMEFARELARGDGWKGKRDRHGEVREVEEGKIIRVPSVHVRGTLDPHCEKGRRLGRWFDEETRIVMEFEMAHNMPGATGDTYRIRDAILKV